MNPGECLTSGELLVAAVGQRPEWEGRGYERLYCNPVLLVVATLIGVGQIVDAKRVDEAVLRLLPVVGVVGAIAVFQQVRRQGRRYYVGPSKLAIVSGHRRVKVETRVRREAMEVYYRRHRNGAATFYFGGRPNESEGRRHPPFPFFTFALVQRPDELLGVFPNAIELGWHGLSWARR